MNLIMESWRSFRLVENIDKLKKDTATATEFIIQLSKNSDKKQLQDVLNTLMADPQIKAAAELFNNLEQEVEKQKKVKQEGIIDDFALRAGTEAYLLSQNPTFQKLIKFGGPVVALAMAVKGLSAEGALDPELTKGAIEVAKASTEANLENGLEIAMGAAEIAGKRDTDIVAR